jgi:TFIIF-interacting CTD phosphatase-like protein
MFRPGAQEFIQHMAKFYELIIFTASMDRYAFPLMEQLDKQHYCEYVL